MPGTNNMLFGALWFFGGAIITAVTYSTASNGGTYIVTYGAIVIGGIQFFFGSLQFILFKITSTNSDHTAGILENELQRTYEWQEIGIDIAKDCYSNGLSKGEIVKLDDIKNFINQNHSFNAQVVENGFLKQISSYIDEGLLISTQEDETGIVFIHTAYASTYI